jgi:hypothetical protein
MKWRNENYNSDTLVYRKEYESRCLTKIIDYWFLDFKFED